MNSENEASELLSEVDFGKLILVVKKSIIWVLLFFATSLFVAYTFLRYTPPIYESSSVIKIKQENEAHQINFARGGNSGEELNDLSGEVELIKSKIIYDQVISNLNLWITYHAEGRLMDEEKFGQSVYEVTNYNLLDERMYNRKIYFTLQGNKKFEVEYDIDGKYYTKIFSINEEVITPHFTMKITFPDRNDVKGDNLYFIIHDRNDLYRYIAGNLSVMPNDRSGTIQINFKDNNRQKAKAIVNQVDSTYLVLTLEDKKKKNEQSIKYIDSQLEKTGEDLKRYEILRESFSQKNSTSDINVEFRRLVDELHRVQNELSSGQVYYDVINNVITLFEKDSISTGVPLLVYINDDRMSKLSEELMTVNNEVNELLKSRTSESLIIKMKTAELNEKKIKVLNMLYDLRDSERQYIEDDKAIEKELWNRIQSLPPKVTMQSQLIRQSNLYGDFYNMLQEKKLEYEIAQAGIVQEFKILSPASLPYMQISPNRAMIYIYAVVVAITLSLIVLILRYMLHNTLISEDDFRRCTNTPILGVVPKHKRKMDVSQLVVHLNPKSSISEAFRSLRTNLEFLSNSKKEKKTFSVTSTISGEGKTFISANLSAIIALSGKKVVLLDLDMRKPKVHLAFGAHNVEGMSTLLIGKTSIDDAIQKTEVHDLDFISAGPVPPNPSELILRDSFDKLIKSLHERYDVILIDTPPTGLVTDGVLIMKKVDVPLYVARSEYTKSDFQKNLNSLYALPEFKNLALIINGASLSGRYGYGYGSYYEEEETPTLFQRIFKRS